MNITYIVHGQKLAASINNDGDSYIYPETWKTSMSLIYHTDLSRDPLFEGVRKHAQVLL